MWLWVNKLSPEDKWKSKEVRANVCWVPKLDPKQAETLPKLSQGWRHIMLDFFKICSEKKWTLTLLIIEFCATLLLSINQLGKWNMIYNNITQFILHIHKSSTPLYNNVSTRLLNHIVYCVCSVMHMNFFFFTFYDLFATHIHQKQKDVDITKQKKSTATLQKKCTCTCQP